MSTHHFTRREALTIGAGLALSPALMAFADDAQRRFKIGACDWSIGLGGQLGALRLAKQIGLDGVQVSFGKPGGQYDLRKEDVRRQYQEAAKQNDVQIASLAMTDLNRSPYATDRDAELWVAECVEVASNMNLRVILLAFFDRGDIKDKPDLQQQVIYRLKKVAPLAEKAGVILGLETWLNAYEHKRILDSVGSPAVQVYYDVANMEKRGYDICKEIRELGRERICEFHCKENGFLLGEGRVDFERVKDAINVIDYSGWLVIESAVGEGKSVQNSYIHNQKYLRSVFL